MISPVSHSDCQGRAPYFPRAVLMRDGWIKLWRQSLDHGWLKNGDLWRFWCWCLLRANHERCTTMVGYQKVELEPGQFVFGRKAASLELGMTQQTVRTCVKNLTLLENLTIKSTNKFSIISITNWSTYQGNDSDHQPTNQQTTNQQLTNNQPATNQQLTTEKNVRTQEYKNERREEASAGPKKRTTKPRIRVQDMTDEEFMTHLEKNPAYEGIDIVKLKAKMESWCLVKGKQPTRARLVNWLNREDVPLKPTTGGNGGSHVADEGPRMTKSDHKSAFEALGREKYTELFGDYEKNTAPGPCFQGIIE